MGQKVNPHGLRVGIIKDWDSKWIAGKKDFDIIFNGVAFVPDSVNSGNFLK